MNTPPPRMQLNRAIGRWIMVDLGGLLLLVLGGLKLALDFSPLPGFPQSGGQAWFCVGLGFVLIAYAAFEILKEFLTQKRPIPPAAAKE